MLTKLFNEKNIGRISLVNMLAIILVLTLAMIVFIVRQNNSEFESERALLVKNFIESKKENLKSEVNRLHDFAKYNTIQTRQKIKDDLKTTVKESAGIINSYHSLLKANMPDMNTQKRLRDFLKDNPWGGKKSYIYVIDKEGKVIFHPEYEPGTDLYNLKTPFGTYPVRTEIDTAFSSGEGFVENMMPDGKGSSEFVQKITYVKKLGLYDWYAASSYDDSYVAEIIQNTIKTRIDTVTFDNEGHYFVFNTEGKGVVMPGNKAFEGANLTSINDSSGVYYYKNLLSYALQKNDLFVFHKQRYDDWNKTRQVISYCKLYEQWNWLMCGTVTMSDLTPLINAKNEALKRKLADNKQYAFVLFLIAALIILCRILPLLCKHTEDFLQIQNRP